MNFYIVRLIKIDILNLLAKNKAHNVVRVDNRNFREMKYSVDGDGSLKEVSDNVNEGMGELIGINLVKKQALFALISNLEKSGDFDYFDNAIQRTINDGFKFIP